jgi:hypothetical protein
MRNGLLMVSGVVLGSLLFTAPAAAESWRACVVGMCLKDACGDGEASVLVSGPIDADDPAVGGDPANGLVRALSQRGTSNGEVMQNCPAFASREEAEATTGRIYTQMSSTFPDTTMTRPEDLFPGYGQSGMAASDPEASESGSNDDSDTQASTSDAGGSDSAEAQATADAADEGQRQQADAEARDRQRAEYEAAEASKREAAAAAAERDRAAAEAYKAEQEAAADKVRHDMDARNNLGCVTQPVLQANASFQGNTGASVVNGCADKVDVKICLMTDKGWNCGVNWGLESQSSWSWSSFNATGEVFMDYRISGSSKQLLNP